MVKSKINVDADKRFHLRITQWSYPICDSWTSTSIRHWLLASQPTSKEYCTVCLWEIFNIILYFPVDCLFRVKTITLETANVTNCHVIATDILFLSSNHRSVQFLYLAASLRLTSAILFPNIAPKFCCRTQEHYWRPRVFSLWSDQDDRMETSNRLSRPDRLEIFGNDWDDRDDHMETRLQFAL